MACSRADRPVRGRRGAFAPTLLLLVAGCAARSEPLPVAGPHPLVASLGTLCQTPLVVALELPDRDRRIAPLETIVAEELQRAGFVVVPTARVTSVWDDATKRGGPIYDPHTGDLDEARATKVREQARTALQRELGCQGLVGARVSLVTAAFSGSRLNWDGVVDEMSGGGGHYGITAAASLWISISDMTGREVYFRAGGIQPLEEIGFAGFVGSPRFEAVAAENVLGDPVRNRRAVQASLQPMLGDKAVLLATRSAAEKRYLNRWEHLRNNDAPR